MTADTTSRPDPTDPSWPHARPYGMFSEAGNHEVAARVADLLHRRGTTFGHGTRQALDAASAATEQIAAEVARAGHPESLDTAVRDAIFLRLTGQLF